MEDGTGGFPLCCMKAQKEFFYVVDKLPCHLIEQIHMIRNIFLCFGKPASHVGKYENQPEWKK